ncbi:MAG: hypothetical protein F6K00_20640 [Leptolyngbya sp. SIOISBB]|nr:hypothetical protein [Leptolyngbya sp. SIOISBB]
MTNWIYTVRERFSPARQDWAAYIEWSGFTHITELITLDTILCGDRIDDLVAEDWQHNLQADCHLTWFTDLNYLRQRCPPRSDQDQLMAAIEQPTRQRSPPAGFMHCGFDILEAEGSISVLTNCGGFPNIFHPTDVNHWGLIDELEVAMAIAQQLHTTFPQETHCHNCQVWQVSRLSIQSANSHAPFA